MAGQQSAERLFLEQLPLIDQVVRIVSKRRGFSEDESTELGSIVRLRMVEDDYRILRSFRGESSLRSYLITTIQRLALDFVIAKSGKWRPSARARRLGEHAVRLERLVVRDRQSPGEAIESLAQGSAGSISRDALLELASQLPLRPRPRTSDQDPSVLERIPDDRTPESALAASRDRVREANRIQHALDRAMASLRAEDRLLLKLRFESGLTVPSIAVALGSRPKRLYKRIDWLLRHLRGALEEAGIAGLERPDLAARRLTLWFGEGPPAVESGFRPSLTREER